MTASRDATLYESQDGSAANGKGSYLFVGRTNQGSVRRGLVMFDLADQVPAGSTVLSATLTMNMSRTTSGPQPVELRRVLASWGEGTSNADSQEGQGAPRTTGDVTWVHRFFGSQEWSSRGGDYAEEVSAVLNVNDFGPYTWGGAARMVADVQAWVDDSKTSFGWILLGNESTVQTSKRFDSRENALEQARPSLTVRYLPPG